MSLENLLKIGTIKSHPSDREEIQRLLEAARRNLADAGMKVISAETRFDAAYKAIMQASLIALMANGFRPDTKKPGHHMTVIQSLPVTMGLESGRMMVLDTLRRQRNLSDYTGDGVDESTVLHCTDEAARLLADLELWLKARHPQLMS